ncbi:MAG: hypothetical protein N3F63_08190, partial [Thermoplasmata archaeon]|nr:hypothetical protein [Thermoplasmata archaeon]
YYDAGNGLCGMPYNVFTVSIGNTPDARMHSISLTNSNNISYGVVTTDSSKLSALFQMFVEKLQLASTGDVTVIEPKPTHTPCAIGKPGIKGISISDMPFVVFADGFRSKNWSAPMLGTWVQWTRTGTWSVNEWNLNFDGYRTCAYTSSSGNTLYTMINASTVLAKLSNTQTAYTINQVNVSFLAYGSMAFDVSTNGSTWTQVVGSTAYNSVYTRISITSYINPTQPFYIRFRSTSWVYIDDVIVQYVLDTQDASGSGGGAAPGNYTISPAKYRYLVTPEVNITNASNATLSFYTKYAITEGTNGGFIYLWVKLPGESTWTWDANHRIYILPKQSYGGNLKMSGVANESTTGGLDGTTGLIDRYGRLPYWCFNGKSAGGTYGWAKVEADLSKYISNFTAVRAVFVFAQFGGQLPPDWRADMGWYIDDVQIKVSGIPTDYWQYVYNP